MLRAKSPSWVVVARTFIFVAGAATVDTGAVVGAAVVAGAVVTAAVVAAAVVAAVVPGATVVAAAVVAAKVVEATVVATGAAVVAVAVVAGTAVLVLSPQAAKIKASIKPSTNQVNLNLNLGLTNLAVKSLFPFVSHCQFKKLVIF